MIYPDEQPDPPITNLHDEIRAGARVILRCLGVVVTYWDATNLPATHPYRHAVAMLAGYLRRRYGE